MVAAPDVVRVLISQARHVWQSRVEIECYSIVQFDCVTVFEVLKCKNFIKRRAHTPSKDA